ncbi:MAG: 1-acylglycerol-3-phosphate O-acyltransferase [Thermoleophilia bacterium]|nr:1-acylglycerol-3-phosphate O-acyltransferase [Thermoleophilia bacterium]
MKIDHLTPEDWAAHDPTWPQRLVRWLWSRPGRVIYRYRGYGAHPRVPTEGGFLLAPGPHGAFVDPFIYALGQPRTRLRFMAKYQALEWPVLGRLIRWAGGFPVHRGGSRSQTALGVAQTVVESGDGLVVFMEGRLELDHTGLGTPRNGLARLALATGVPVIPVAAWGSKRARAYGKRWWYHWPRVTVVWGEQLQFPKEDDPSEERVAQVRDEIWAQVHVCFDQAKAIEFAPGRRPRRGTPLEQALPPGVLTR